MPLVAHRENIPSLCQRRKHTRIQTQNPSSAQLDFLNPLYHLTFEDRVSGSFAISLIMSQQRNPYTNKPYTNAYHLMRQQAAELPVSRRMPQLLATIRNNPVTIIIGETGSGKSTQIPKRMLESLSSVFKGDVCLIQPRKLATQSVSSRTSHLRGASTNQ